MLLVGTLVGDADSAELVLALGRRCAASLTLDFEKDCPTGPVGEMVGERPCGTEATCACGESAIGLEAPGAGAVPLAGRTLEVATEGVELAGATAEFVTTAEGAPGLVSIPELPAGGVESAVKLGAFVLGAPGVAVLTNTPDVAAGGTESALLLDSVDCGLVCR